MLLRRNINAFSILLTNTDTDNEPIYNVCGQRISKAKGLVIKGSKKYFVK